jgi:alpha-L-fucosidase 2
MLRFKTGMLVAAMLPAALWAAGSKDESMLESLSKYNVTWTTPSEDSSGSMPLGNGDIGLNAWVEATGELVFYISKTDSWDENGRLLKLGRVRVSLEPNPFMDGSSFEQTLKLVQGEMFIHAEKTDAEINVRTWVDANLPVVRVEIDSTIPVTAKCQLEVWRTQPREITGMEYENGVRELSRNGGFRVTEHPDTIVTGQKDRIVWYHRNDYTTYPVTLENQHLEGFLGQGRDPLQGRTFGGCILGTGWTGTNSQTLMSAQPVKQQAIAIHLLTAQTNTAKEWVDQLNSQVERVEAVFLSDARQAHQRWWEQFWNRSWIFVESGENATDITHGYTLQRYINACGGRGAYAIKFNGSIFTVDAREDDKKPENRQFFNADYRNWGGNYWFQNTRLPYWAMLAAGDFDLMQPLFNMYSRPLPLAQYQTRQFFQHDGAFFPETMYFWGTYCNCDFGWGNTTNIATNKYIRYYWTGAVELATMMLDYYSLTGDEKFARETMLPFVEPIMTFYDQHWKRDAKGKIFFEPAQSLETWHTATNPLPEIAGLKYTLTRLVDFPDSLVNGNRREQWRRMLTELPDVPVEERDGVKVIAPAEKYSDKANCEDTELYAVFPYRLFGVGKPQLGMGRDSYFHRRVKMSGGWRQEGIQAAYLGLTEEAAKEVTYNYTHKHPGSRFPAFWGPNFDWIPDQDHGTAAMTALQRMLLQYEGDKMTLFPAWPKGWDVVFNLHAPRQTTIEGVFRGGKLESLKVEPESRRKDLEILKPQ